MTPVRAILGALGLALVLTSAGCSSDDEASSNLLVQAATATITQTRARRQNAGPQPVVEVTPQQLANTKVAALQVNPEVVGGSDFLRRIALREDQYPGQVAVWRSSDDALLYLRNGVLIGSRNVGYDIISSDAGDIIQALRTTRPTGGQRRYYVSRGDYTDVELVMSCDIRNLGGGVTQVVNLQFQTVHMREACIGGSDDRIRIVNDYWVQPGSGIVRKSRQWAGPASGYFELILLKN